MNRLLRIIGVLVLLLLFGTGGAVLGAATWWGHDLPATDRLERISPAVKSQVFDIHGSVIGEFFIENRSLVRLRDVPGWLTDAFIATEDRRFYQHWGVDVFRLGKAAMRDIKEGRPAEGAGTITQQLARNLFLTHEKTFSRKIKETVLALQIERRYSKDEILEMYENQIYFGEGAYGVQAAASTFFAKDVRHLSLPECALLAGLPRNPSAYSPRRQPQNALKRRQVVLRAMLDTGKITRAEYATASAAPLGVTPSRAARQAPYFMEIVRQRLEEKYGANMLNEGGLRVYTTLDLQLQHIAEEALERQLSELEVVNKYRARFSGPAPAGTKTTRMSSTPYVQGAMIVMDAKTGGVRVMIGGRNHGDSGFNRATQARRQTGSLWKPLVYVAALDNGYHATDTIIDEPIDLPAGNGSIWSPQNYDHRFRGTITLQYALQHSVNIPAVLLARAVGTTTVASYARRLGVTSPIVTELSMALGTSEVTLQEMMTVYTTLANDGVRPTPLLMLKVLDRNGQVLENNTPEYKEAVRPETAEQATAMLRTVLDGGTAYSSRLAGLTIPAAGKTGTTSDYTDAWFIGYTPDLAAGVWVGFDREQTLGDGMTGSRAALPVWTDFMLRATQGKPARDFPRPTQVVTRTVCPVTGLLATVDCPDPVAEAFSAGEEPRALCDVHPGELLDQSLPKDKRTPIGEPADDEVHVEPPTDTEVDRAIEAPPRTPPASGRRP